MNKKKDRIEKIGIDGDWKRWICNNCRVEIEKYYTK